MEQLRQETMACRLFTTRSILLQISVLILALSFTVDGFTLEDQLKHLTKNYVRTTHFYAKSHDLEIFLILIILILI